MNDTAPRSDPMTLVLETYRRQEATDFGNAWVGMEPTCQTEKSVRKWRKLSVEPGGDDAYFRDGYMLKTQTRHNKPLAFSVPSRTIRLLAEP